MLSGRRYRLDLKLSQVELCQRFADVCRVVWNTGLEQRREYRRRGAWMNYVPQAAQMAEAKADHPWLAEAPSHILQQTLRDLDRACLAHGTFKVRWRVKTAAVTSTGEFHDRVFARPGEIERIRRLQHSTPQGIAVSGRGDLGAARSTKRQPSAAPPGTAATPAYQGGQDVNGASAV